MEYDKIVVEFQYQGKSVVSAALDKETIDTLGNQHEIPLDVIVSDMVTTMINESDARDSK